MYLASIRYSIIYMSIYGVFDKLYCSTRHNANTEGINYKTFNQS
jgi:hypothetical protein